MRSILKYKMYVSYKIIDCPKGICILELICLDSINIDRNIFAVYF